MLAGELRRAQLASLAAPMQSAPSCRQKPSSAKGRRSPAASASGRSKAEQQQGWQRGARASSAQEVLQRPPQEQVQLKWQLVPGRVPRPPPWRLDSSAGSWASYERR